jgi:hypothetical protein
MSAARSNAVLILSRVHPDLLPSLYSVSEVLRDRGAEVHLITFSSPTAASQGLGDGIQIHDCGSFGDNLRTRIAARRRFRRFLRSWLGTHRPRAILAACPFAYLEGLRFRQASAPLVFLFYEMYDANLKILRRSPATAIRNWRALRSLGEATLVCTPSPERAGWLVGRAGLDRLPAVVLNSPARSLERTPADSRAVLKRLPAGIRGRPLVINTGGMSPSRAVKELVASVEYWQSDAALLLTNADDTPYGADVRRLAQSSRRRDDIVLLPLLPRGELLALQRMAAVGMNLQPSDDNLDIMFPAPNKISEYVHAGLVIVASESLFTNRLVERGLAVVAKSLDPREIAAAVDTALVKAQCADTKSRVLSAARDWYCMDVQLAPVLRAIGYA